MKKFTFFVCILLATNIFELRAESEEEKVVRQLNWVVDANPEKDAENAIKENDFHMIGIRGFTVFVPIENEDCWNKNLKIKAVEGTSDVVLGYRHAKLIAIATTYAQYYNELILKHLEHDKSFKCNS